MMSQKFEYEETHLTPEYGAIFLRTTLEKAEEFFKADSRQAGLRRESHKTGDESAEDGL